ncbi:MAG: TolC family protein [Candidatus Methylacidiphilales bacterium]
MVSHFRLIKSLICGALVSGYGLAHGQTVTQLTLLDCYQRAAAQSEALAISSESIRQAEARYWQALSTVLPEVNLVASERLRNNRGGGFSGNSSGSDSGNGSGGSGGRRDRFETQLQVSMNIFRGFRDYHQLGIAQASRRASVADLLRDQHTLFLDVSDLYYQILSQRSDLAILQDLDAALIQRIEELNERVQLGRSRSSELLAARTEHVENQASMRQVAGLISAGMELMAFLIARPVETFTLADDQPVTYAESLSNFLSGLARRPDLEAQSQRVEISNRQVSSARGAFLPTLDFQFNWLALENPERDQDWNLFFTASLPVFDGGLRASELSLKKSEARVSSLNLDRLRRLAEYDVRLAYSDFQSATSQLVVLSEAVQVAQANVSAQQEDYRLGRASNLDALNALIRYHGVRRRQALTTYLTRSTLNALHVASGELPATAR